MKRPRQLPRWVRAALWCSLGPAALLALARLLGAENQPISFLLVAAAPLVYLPTYLTLAAAIWARRWLLAAPAFTLVAASVIWFMPEYRFVAVESPPTPDAARLRILTHNVRFGNDRLDLVTREIRNSDADVVILQEVGEGALETLERLDAFADYSHRIADPRGGGYGIGIWSRTPLVDAVILRPEGVAMPRATVSTAACPVRIYGVHLLSARWKGVNGLGRQFESLRTAVQGDHQAGYPVIVAGDFNAVWSHQPFRQLLSTGLVDAAVELGQGWRATWPADTRYLPPALRLDHVLVSDLLTPQRVTVGAANGSDHRSVLVDVAVPPCTPRPTS